MDITDELFDIPLKQKPYPFRIITDSAYYQMPDCVRTDMLYFKSDDNLTYVQDFDELDDTKDLLRDALGYFGCGTRDHDSVYIMMKFTSFIGATAVLFHIKCINSTKRCYLSRLTKPQVDGLL